MKYKKVSFEKRALFNIKTNDYIPQNAFEKGILKWSPEVKPLAGLGRAQKKGNETFAFQHRKRLVVSKPA